VCTYLCVFEEKRRRYDHETKASKWLGLSAAANSNSGLQCDGHHLHVKHACTAPATASLKVETRL
jgi:hypothetical protein